MWYNVYVYLVQVPAKQGLIHVRSAYPGTPVFVCLRVESFFFFSYSLDILSVLLTKTRQTLAKDATLTAFEDVLLETLRVRVCAGVQGGRGVREIKTLYEYIYMYTRIRSIYHTKLKLPKTRF